MVADCETDENDVKWGEDEYGSYKINDKIWTMNEIRDLPLFMEDVPMDISDNPHLLALQNLVYDGNSQEEMAEHFKNLGNEAFRSSTNKISSKNALLSYTKGLEMECKDDALNSQLHSNRAAVSMRLKQNDKAMDDCRRAVKLDPKNTKAYYRGAKASEAMGLTQQAITFCHGALELKPDDKELLQINRRLKEQLEKEEKEHDERRKCEVTCNQQFSSSRSAVVNVLESRNCELGPVIFDLAMYFHGRIPEPNLMEDAPDAVGWPLLLLYDETCQSDFVEVFDERCELHEQFQIMFPGDRFADWDQDEKYVWDKLVGYMEFYKGKGKESDMRRIPLNVPLQDSLRGVRIPQCLVLHVLVDKSGAHASFCTENHLAMP